VGTGRRKRRGRKKDWKSGPSFFEEEGRGELGNDIGNDKKGG
jgi:hypothetical protein